jgi:hypothetical protein
VLAVAVLGCVTTALVDWNLPQTGWPGYASWNFGAVTWLCFFLAFRGRILAAWILLFLMAGITTAWAISVGRGALGAIDLVDRHAGTLLMATLFSLLLSRTSARITALTQQRLVQEAALASAEAEFEERSVQAAQLTTEARPAVERIASGDPLSAAERQDFEVLEAALRDTLRGGSLVVPSVARAVESARRRGAHVVLMDDSTSFVDASATERVHEAIVHEVDAMHSGVLTARLLPEGRGSLATLVRSDDETRSRLEVPLMATPTLGTPPDAT